MLRKIESLRTKSTKKQERSNNKLGLTLSQVENPDTIKLYPVKECTKCSCRKQDKNILEEILNFV